MARKKPFSGKQKKEQLKQRRFRKEQKEVEFDEMSLQHQKKKQEKVLAEQSKDNENDAETKPTGLGVEVDMLHYQSQYDNTSKQSISQRYRLHFVKESQTEIEARKAESRKPLVKLPKEELEVSYEEVYGDGIIDIPFRPEWDYKMSKEDLEKSELKYFREWVDKTITNFGDRLSFFELNLETWRQLWRVLEISDIILLIADIRHPIFHFPPSLYNYVSEKLQKPMVLILNKVDLVSEPTRKAWKAYFEEIFPNVHVTLFTSYPHEESTDLEEFFRKKRGRMKKHKLMAWGADQILEACEHCVINKETTNSDGKVEMVAGGFGEWHKKVQDMKEYRKEQEILHADDEEEFINTHLKQNQRNRKNKKQPLQQQNFEESDSDDEDPETLYVTPNQIEVEDSVDPGIVTVGVVGSPNVGKSSILNGLVGKKVVSASRTPGHTKHFQTIYLTPHIRLCDSPGIVFPSLLPKSLQILAGIYPISQVREPYSVVGYLAQRVPLVEVLKIDWPYTDDDYEGTEEVWSAWSICDAWAKKRGFFTAKAGHLDTYRAANSILRLAVDGRLVLSAKPPGYYTNKYVKDNEIEENEDNSEDENGDSEAQKKDKKIQASVNPFSMLME